MSYIPKVASWESSLVDGWVPVVSGETYYYWEPSLAGGFWSAYLETVMSGEIYGEGLISGDVQHYIMCAISGDVTGIGYIFSEIGYKEPIAISGECYGIGSIYSRFNFSRQRALTPILKRNSTYDLSDAPIAAIEYVDFSPNKVLNVISREDSIYENTAEFYLTETVTKDGTYFPITHYPYIDNASGKMDYLVTDYKAQGQNGKALFYQYELLFDAYTIEDGEIVTLYKNNEVKIDRSQYVIQASYDLLGRGAERYGATTTTTWHPLDPSQTIHRIRILLPIDHSSQNDFYIVTYNKSVYGARTAQTELVELVPIYTKETDYIIVESGILLTPTSKINSDTQTLYINKDPEDRIRPVCIDPPSFQPDEISSWRLRLNPGSVLTRSGLYNNQDERFYLLDNKYIDDDPKQFYAITNVKPVYISENIVKVDQYPIYINEETYIYPNYTIGLYDKKDLSLTTEVGLVSIEVNGKSRTDIKILSIDRKRGYFQLSEPLDQTDEIEFNFYVDPTYYFVLENLELNPKVTGGSEMYHISGFMKGLGVALKEYDPHNQHTFFPYIYDSFLPESSRTYYEVPPIGETPSTCPSISGNFWPIGEISINRISTDIIKLTDARRIGGGVEDNSLLESWFSNRPEISIRECDSYLGKAYYGGDPQSFGGNVVIHVPSGVLYGARDRWIASLSGVVNDSIEQVERGTREFNYYLDKVIKRYVSAGTDYILIPVDISGNFLKIENLTYDNII